MIRINFFAGCIGLFFIILLTAACHPSGRTARSEPVSVGDSAQVKLGTILFFDPRLSRDGTVACATCHNPRSAWTDRLPVAVGIQGRKGIRRSPSLSNVAGQDLLFRDGRAASLEAQVWGPITHPDEMGRESPEALVRELRNIPGYRPLFRAAFGDDSISPDHIAAALAEFERTLRAGNSRFDQYRKGKTGALDASELRGMNLFFGRANCVRCHSGSNFSDGDFHNLGVGMDRPMPDWGRYLITKDEEKRGAFKTPRLRDVSKRPPYMHDGSLATLVEVIDFYDRGGNPNPWISPRNSKLHLGPREKQDLLAFLKALESQSYPRVREPKRLP